MRSIRTLLLHVLFILSGFSLFAGRPSTRPIFLFHKKLSATVKNADGNLNLSKNMVNSRRKICSCQILNLQSANYQHHNVAVFAEKTNYGHISSDFGIAKGTIEREKKHLKLFFYDKLTVVDHLSETTDCRSLYLRLKSTDQSLVLYDILDADSRKQ